MRQASNSPITDRSGVNRGRIGHRRQPLALWRRTATVSLVPHCVADTLLCEAGLGGASELLFRGRSVARLRRVILALRHEAVERGTRELLLGSLSLACGRYRLILTWIGQQGQRSVQRLPGFPSCAHGLARPAPVPPLRRPDALAPRRRLRPGRGAAVHPAPAVLHRWPLASRARPGARTAARCLAGIARRIAVPQPAASRRMGCCAHF